MPKDMQPVSSTRPDRTGGKPSSRRGRGTCTSLLAVASLIATPGAARTLGSPTAAAMIEADQMAGNQAVSVNGNRLMRDGAPWNPHGVQLIAFVQGPVAQAYYMDPKNSTADEYATKWKWFKQAYDRFSNAELDDIKAWGADTVRFQVSLYAADPMDDGGEYDPAFVQKLVSGVKYARQIGLNAIVSIQGERQIRGMPALPNARVQRDWQNLAQLLKNNGASDNGIIFELYNEPNGDPKVHDDWVAWANAMNATVKTIRDTGSTNVVLADGLNMGQVLHGFIPLSDPRVFYAVHPYFYSGRLTESWWDYAFGDAAQTVPVINGEWTTLTNNTYEQEQGSAVCNDDTPQTALNLLSYQRRHNVGLIAVTYDSAKKWGGIVQDYTGTPTTFVGTDCQNALGRFGPGRTIQYWYRNNNLPGDPL